MWNVQKSIILPSKEQFDPAKQPFGGTRCRNCGAKLTQKTYFYVSHGKPYCPSCIEEATVEDLVRFCETMWEDWVEEMGILTVSPDALEGGGEWD